MKPRLFLCCIFLIGAYPAVCQNFGLTVGLNYQQLSDISFNKLDVKFKSKEGWHVGAWFEFALGPIGVRPGVRYISAGQLFDGVNEKFPLASDSFQVSLLEVPVLLRYGLSAPVIGPYVFLGPLIRFPSFSDKVISNDLAPVSVGGEGGIGLQIRLGSIYLYPEVAYVFGFSNFTQDEIIIDFVTLTPSGGQRLNTAMVRISIGF